MTITAKYAATCPACSKSIAAGSKIEWSKGSPARHAACAGGSGAATPVMTVNSYGRPVPESAAARVNRAAGARRYGARRECKTGGNCSSFGSGRSCGAEECDGY